VGSESAYLSIRSGRAPSDAKRMTCDAVSAATGLAAGVAWSAAVVAAGPTINPSATTKPITPAGAGNRKSNRDLRRERAVVLRPPPLVSGQGISRTRGSAPGPPPILRAECGAILTPRQTIALLVASHLPHEQCRPYADTARRQARATPAQMPRPPNTPGDP